MALGCPVVGAPGMVAEKKKAGPVSESIAVGKTEGLVGPSQPNA